VEGLPGGLWKGIKGWWERGAPKKEKEPEEVFMLSRGRPPSIKRGRGGVVGGKSTTGGGGFVQKGIWAVWFKYAGEREA